MHLPPQRTCEPRQLVTQALEEQTWPEGHAVPGVPGAPPTAQSPDAPQ
jgi:hypothetical protein